MEYGELVVALVLILVSAELFTNALEWIGESFGLSEGAVGSVLAAVGTALPETMLPLVAIIFGAQSGHEIGIGAILGAPLMLTTLAMFVLGVATLLFAREGRRSRDITGDRRILLQDLGYFLTMYVLAVVAGLYHHRWFKVALAVTLFAGYAVYVYRHFRGPADAVTEREVEGEELGPLRLRKLLARFMAGGSEWPVTPPRWASVGQALVALAGIIGGARVFVAGVTLAAHDFGIPELVLALLLAPLATELPEKFNSVLWVRRRKDTLALGNITGAMVFQSSFPVSVGILLTPWRLTGDALVAALVALGAGSILWITLKVRGALGARLLLLQGVLYGGYVAYVLTRL